MKSFKAIVTSFLAVAVLMFSGSAWAKDAVVAAVSNPLPDPPGAVIVENGTHYSRGTYAVGTIQLFYTVIGTQFSAGCNHSFTVDLSIVSNNKTKPVTKYPTVLSFRQTGSANLELQPSQSSFNVADASFTSTATVDICVPTEVAEDPLFQVDGAELVANLQLETPIKTYLDTVTTIQVHLLLVHPSETACLKTFGFFANNGITATGELTSTNPILVERRTMSQNKVTSPTQPKYIIVVVNTCSENQCIDGRFTINGDYDLGPGQPVQGFSSNSIIDEYLEVSTFFSTSPVGDPNLDTGTCVTVTDNCITIPVDNTFLLKVDINIDAVNAVWPPPATYTGFGATILNGGSTANCTVAGTAHALADPNPLVSSLAAACNDAGGANDDCPE